MIRTWKEQQAHEAAERKAWLQSLIDTGKPQAEIAREVGIDRAQLCKLVRENGLAFPRVRQPLPDMTPEQLEDYRAFRRAKFRQAEALAALGFDG